MKVNINSLRANKLEIKIKFGTSLAAFDSGNFFLVLNKQGKKGRITVSKHIITKLRKHFKNNNCTKDIPEHMTNTSLDKDQLKLPLE